MKRYKRNIIHKRINYCKFMVFIVFIGLLVRLYHIQILDKNNLKLASLKQRSKEIILNSKRGPIFDRNLVPLTDDNVFRILIFKKEKLVKDEKLLRTIKENTSLSSRELRNVLNSPNILIEIPINKDLIIAEDKDILTTNKVNRYSDKALLSHVIGYINDSQNKGETGIEKSYDEFLNKTDKKSLFVEYDKSRSVILGKEYYVDNSTLPTDPTGVQLTIDYNIQSIVEDILDRKKIKGAVIVTEAKTGEILSLASRPNFDQNHMKDYFTRDDMALYNKAIQVSYPPGSIFKIVVFLAAVEEDLNFLDKEFHCKGNEIINNVEIKCNSLHGDLSLTEGFAKSCNSVFIQMGKEIGSKKIIEMAKRLGFGNKINIGLTEEIEGLLPQDDDLLGAAIGNISIGQGKIQVTPLQITNMLLTIVNDGMQKDMSIVKGITNKDGIMIKAYNKEEDKFIVAKDIVQTIRKPLEEVLVSGTARRLDLNEIGGAGGKTGSAEGSLSGKKAVHGWFTGYYPKDDPKYVITVLVEDGRSGSLSAAPIFEEICKKIN